MRRYLALVLLLWAGAVYGQVNAASCSSTDVQTAVNTATEGQTVNIPACPAGVSWTSNVIVSGKGINIKGAGSGRVVGFSITPTTLVTGNPKTFTITPTNVAGTMPTFAVGQKLLIAELAFYGIYNGATGTTNGNFLFGTVNSFNSSTGVLSMNITSVGGTCGRTEVGAVANCARWMISTSPSVNETVLINNLNNVQAGMFNVTVDGSFNTSISGIHFAQGATPGEDILVTTNSSLGPAGAKSALIHDNMLENATLQYIDAQTNQIVIWNNTFINSNFQSSNSALHISDNGGNIGNYAWTTASLWGTLDTGGQSNLYFETNDIEGVVTATDFSAGARAVFRDNYMNESSIGTHGADTGTYGMRYVEFYNNTFVHQLYTGCGGAHPDPVPNCSGSNLSEIGPGNGWFNIRGGTFALHDNIMPTLSGGELGSKPDITLQDQNLNRLAGPHACWGLGTTGGAQYFTPRQVGRGFINGSTTTKGVDFTCTGNGTPTGCTANQFFGPASVDPFAPVGDSEPAYMWNNTISPLNVNTTDNQGTQACTNPPNPDLASNYIVANRDYFNGTTAKPNYTPFTYPHPLTLGTATSTPILSPNNGQTGNSADSLQPATLTFGNQGTNTSSMAIPISINNCSTPVIAACNGTGNLTLAATPLAITGPNAVDFTFALGTCSANQVIASGGTCSPTITFKPTATAGTVETATLTVSYANGTPSQTMALTGTSATVVALPACGSTLTGSTIYQATANVTCNGTAYLFTGAPQVNLDGFTVTWNNTAQTACTGAFLTAGFGVNISVYNGVISQGAGTNSVAAGSTCGVIGAQTNLNFGDSNAFFNLTFNYSFQYWSAIYMLGPGTVGGNGIVHDVIVNDTAVGNCSNPGCRSQLQSVAIRQPGAVNQPATPTHIYNVVVNGSAQGGIHAQAPGAVIEHNLVNIGNVTGTNSNNFGIYVWGPVTAHDNIINTPLGSNNGRGLAMQGDGGAGNKSSFNNVIQAFELPNSTEYASNAGCEIGGVYGIQFDDNPQGSSINSNGNTVNVFVNKCGGSGLRLTDTRLTTNTSTNNIYTVSRQTGALDCTINTQSDPNFGCAMGVSIAGNSPPPTPPFTTAFTSTGDTFTADSGEILLGTSGAQVSSLVFQSPTFNKGSNPSPTWHTFWAANGVPGSLQVIDATVGPGVSLTDTRFLAQSANQAPVSFYIQWTQKVTVLNGSAAPINGATVTYTGPFETDTCTTNSSGVCSVVVTQNRLNNDTAANQVEVRNPYTRTVAASGFTTNTVTGITLTSPNTLTVTLSSGSTPAAPPTFSPVAGTYVGPQPVTMSSTTAGFTITFCFDTTNTCTPSTVGSTFTVSSNGFLRAFANASGFTQSTTSSAQYVIQATPPIFSPTPGSYVGPTSVSLSSTTGTVICYTTNGITPSTNGTGAGCTAGVQYTASIPLVLSTTINAVAGAVGLADSPVAIGNFGIEGAAAPSVFAFRRDVVGTQAQGGLK